MTEAVVRAACLENFREAGPCDGNGLYRLDGQQDGFQDCLFVDKRSITLGIRPLTPSHGCVPIFGQPRPCRTGDPIILARTLGAERPRWGVLRSSASRAAKLALEPRDRMALVWELVQARIIPASSLPYLVEFWRDEGVLATWLAALRALGKVRTGAQAVRCSSLLTAWMERKMG